ncbi:MAG: dual specificity protein phosphatase family protein [Acidobacteria bacterium]|nr:dual specificity protein phosphatase family protein [Acidobacteriota bacterium]
MAFDFDFITPRLAVGGGIWTRERFEQVMRGGITHIINTQKEFDDRSLRLDGDPSSREARLRASSEPDILWLAMDDDFFPKRTELFHEGARFALKAFEQPGSKLLVHCASGVHRGPMVALAILRVLGYGRRDAVDLLRARRPTVDFPDVYLDSVEMFVAEWETS